MANRKINELSVRTPSLTDLMIVGDPSTGYSFKATLAALNTLIDSSTSIGDLNGVVITSPTNGQALVYNGTNWVNQSISVPVTSVFGRTGAVVAIEGDYSLDLLSDVTLTTPSSNQVLQYNGTAWVNATLTDNGITSLNGLTALSQTFATGTSGTDFAISSTTSTHTFNLPTASAVNRGALSSADWSTFNAKQDAITLTTTGSSGSATLVGATLNIPTYTLSGLGGISGSGTSGQVAYWTGTSSQSGSSTFLFSPTSELDLANSVTASGAIARGGRIRPTLVAAANNDVLVGLDINPTFTNGSFTGIRNFGLRVTTANGVEAARFTSPSGQFLIMPRLSSVYGAYLQALDAAGTATQPLSFSSNKFVFESGNVLINSTTDGGQRLQVNGTSLLSGNTTVFGGALTVNASSAQISIQNAASSNKSWSLITSGNNLQIREDGIGFPMQFNAGGNVLANQTSGTFTIGSATPSVAKLQVTGSITASSAIARGVNFNNTLVASANNDVLVGLDIEPTFTNGAFTGVSNLGLRVQGSAGTNLSISNTLNTYGNTSISSTTATTHIFYALPHTNGGEIAFQANNTGQTSTPRIAFYNSSSVRLAQIFADNLGMQLGARQPSGSVSTSMYVYAAANRNASQLALTTVTGDLSDNNTVIFRGHWTGANALILKAFSSSSTVPTLKVRNVNDNADVLSVTSSDNVLIGSSTDGGQKLQVTGTASITGDLTLGNNIRISTNAAGFRVNTSSIGISSSTGINATDGFLWQWANTQDGSNVTRNLMTLGGVTSIGHPSGTNDTRILNIAQIINTTGGTNTVRGIYYNPTLTSTTGTTHIAIQTVSGNVLFGTTSGSVGVGTSTINASAILELSSTTKGFLPPKGTNAQMLAIASPVSGLVFYDTTNNKLNVYDGTNWVAVH